MRIALLLFVFLISLHISECGDIVLESEDSWPKTITPEDLAPAHHKDHPRVRSLWFKHFMATSFQTNIKRCVQSTNVLPVAFGADPTGTADSTAAFQKAIAALLSFAGSTKLAGGISDLGGAKFDLAGGTFLLSAPLTIPKGYGNFVISGGTLIASSSFPFGRCLVEIGSGCARNSDCNQFVDITNLHLICSQRAGSGVCVTSGRQVNVGPHILVTSFTATGIVVDTGFEVQVRENWIGQYYWTEGKLSTPNTTGIGILGNDHFITNNVIFSADVGLVVTGAANIITGLHTWNKALSYGGIGILFTTSTASYTQNRVVDSYLDYNSIVTHSPEHLIITNSFFLGSSNIVIVAFPSKPSINGLYITQNEFDSYGFSNDTIVLDQRQAKFTSVEDVVIENNMVANGVQMVSRTTKSSAKLTLSQSNMWTFDFSKELLFPFVTKAQYSVSWQNSQFAQHFVEIPATGTTVTVHTDKPVSGTVYMDVDQNSIRQAK